MRTRKMLNMKSRAGFLLAGVALGALIMNADGFLSEQAKASSSLSDVGTVSPLSLSASQEIAPLTTRNGQLSFADVVERVSPAVVSVLVEQEVEAQAQRRVPRGLPPGFERFFNFPGAPEGGADNDDPFEGEGVRRQAAQGSGFFVDKKGHIVTNHHVVEGGDNVKVRLADGTELEAEIVGSDPLTDLAVLKVKADAKQPFVSFSDKVDLRVGDWVVAVGNPFGLGGTVTSGIVSAIGGRDREQQYVDMIQIDAAINRGNSGGPAFDLSGRVIGVNVAIFSPNGGNVGIGFAIPAKTASSIVDQLITKGEVTRGFLGILLAPVSQDVADALSLANTDGVLVNEVSIGSPAAKGGVKNGDVITALDGVEVKGPNDLSRRIANYPPGRKVKVDLLRNGSKKKLTVVLGERTADALTANAGPQFEEEESSTVEDLGVRVTTITDEARSRYRLPDEVKGVVATAVKPGSPAEQAGIRPGVVILEVNYEAVSSPKDLESKIEEARKNKKDAALLRLQRGTNKSYSALRLDDE